jgi:hypothetical protein
MRCFQTPWINEVIREKISSFTDNAFEIYVSSGKRYPPIQINVHEFSFVDKSLLISKMIKRDKFGNQASFERPVSLPVGLIPSEITSQDILAKLKEHVRDIAASERNYLQMTGSSTSQLSWDVYEAIRSYQKTDSTVSLNFNIRDLCSWNR